MGGQRSSCHANTTQLTTLGPVRCGGGCPITTVLRAVHREHARGSFSFFFCFLVSFALKRRSHSDVDCLALHSDHPITLPRNCRKSLSRCGRRLEWRSRATPCCEVKCCTRHNTECRCCVALLCGLKRSPTDENAPVCVLCALAPSIAQHVAPEGSQCHGNTAVCGRVHDAIEEMDDVGSCHAIGATPNYGVVYTPTGKSQRFK